VAADADGFGIRYRETRQAVPARVLRSLGEGSGAPPRERHAACFADVVIDQLNTLLRAELAAVAGYQKVLRKLRDQAASDCDQMLRLASEHQRTVTALHGSVQARGGSPMVEASPWEGSGAAELMAEGDAVRLESTAFVTALLDVEQRGLADYEAAVPSLDEDARELVELELIPRQRRHVTELSALLVRLAA